MGITLFTINGLLAPLQSFMAWLSPPHSPSARAEPGPRPGCNLQTPAFLRAARHARLPSQRRLPMQVPVRVPALRVVRVVEAAGAPASAGRMFMSGRMADVCAELDRLAAMETATS